MDATISIRRLGPADVALLRSLNELFGAAFDDLETYTRAPPADEYLSDLMSSTGTVTVGAWWGFGDGFHWRIVPGDPRGAHPDGEGASERMS